MAHLLMWLALPLLLIPWLAGAHRTGASAGQLVMAGLGLAALHQGAGTLDPRDLRTIAGQSPHDAWFVAITAGVLIAGACLLPDIRNWRKGLPAVPLLVALLIASLPHIMPLAIGLVVGAIPTVLATLTAGAGSALAPSRLPDDAEMARGNGIVSLALAGVTIVMAAIAPAVLCMLGLGTLVWREWFRDERSGASRPLPVLQLTTTVLLIGWTWFTLTIAGSPLLSIRAVADEAPISPAAAQGLGLLAIGWAIGIAGPWPLDRLVRVGLQLPAVAIVFYLAGVTVVPDGITHWQPVVSTVLVASALSAVAVNRWDGAAAAMMLLAATRGGAIAVLGAVVMALAPSVRRVRLPARVRGALAGVAVALVLIVLLRDQVLLSVILAVGVASLASRTDHLVARRSRPGHL
jgi:hypothetical protein